MWTRQRCGLTASYCRDFALSSLLGCKRETTTGIDQDESSTPSSAAVSHQPVRQFHGYLVAHAAHHISCRHTLHKPDKQGSMAASTALSCTPTTCTDSIGSHHNSCRLTCCSPAIRGPSSLPCSSVASACTLCASCTCTVSASGRCASPLLRAFSTLLAIACCITVRVSRQESLALQ